MAVAGHFAEKRITSKVSEVILLSPTVVFPAVLRVQQRYEGLPF